MYGVMSHVCARCGVLYMLGVLGCAVSDICYDMSGVSGVLWVMFGMICQVCQVCCG